MLGLSSDNPARKVTVSVRSLAAPTAGNSILFNAMTTANANSSGSAWTATDNRLVVTGSKPTVTNGMVSPGIQFYTGANGAGDFMTFSGDNLVPVTSYNNFSGDWSSANATDIVNVTAAATLTGSGVLNIHALRIASNTAQNLGNRTVALGSGGLLLGAHPTISNGTLDFGSNPGFISEYNSTTQGTISAKLSGSGGLTFFGVMQGLNLTNNSNDFTGGLFINGGTVTLGNGTGSAGATAANGNDVVVNDLGALAVNVGNATATIGGLSGDGDVAPQYQATAARSITISPSSGTHTFTGTIRNGAAGSVLNVIKSGAGTQVFGSGITATYNGTTAVNAGTLLINGNMSAATGAVTVASGATLGGSGIIGGATTINGTLAPGNSPGLLTFNSTLTLNTGSNTLMEIGATTTRGGTFDAVDVVGALTYGGNLTLNMTQTYSAGNYTWDLFNFGSQSGNFANVLLTGNYSGNLSNSGGTWSLSSGTETWTFTQSDGILTLSVIPEPATWALLAASLTAMVIFRRRRRVC